MRPRGKHPQQYQPRIRVNQFIRADEVFVIDETGTARGNMSVTEALKLADAAEMDLVEISPNAKPPVVKITDFGKYKYDQTKAKARQRAHSHDSEVKEVRLSVRIGEHDLEVKAKQAMKFLGQKHKVKATVVFRGREMAHQELGRTVLERFIDRLKDIAKMEQAPTQQGRSLYIVLVSIK